MATLEGENASTPVALQGPENSLLLPVLSGENVTDSAGSSIGSSSIPRVSVDRDGIARRSAR